mmetsp:Transcript_25212/g.53164  ORF Transcript_25212/g.53164 Transcript_25212/m.53164 type:complete len:241 (+) Transcript_25212:238-960(+)
MEFVTSMRPTGSNHPNCPPPDNDICSDDDGVSRFSDADFIPDRRNGQGDGSISEVITSRTPSSKNHPGSDEPVVPNAVLSSNNADATLYKCESDDDQETVSLSIKSEGYEEKDFDPQQNYFKCETDDEIESSEPNESDDCPLCGTENDDDVSSKPPKIKEESTIYELQHRQAMQHRKYGDRVLLARQAPNGMMKLGGGNVNCFLWPNDVEKRMARMKDTPLLAMIYGISEHQNMQGRMAT